MAANQHSDKPWLTKSKWKDGRIRSSGVVGLVVLWIIALILSGVGVYLIVTGGNHGIKFLLGGIAVFIWASIETLRYKKFGTSVLELVTFPGVVGGQLVGVIHTRNKIQPLDGYHLNLKCTRSLTTGRGKGRRTQHSVLWEESATMKHEIFEHDPSRTAIPVGFRIPADCRPCDESNPGDVISWQLAVKAKVAGLNYYAHFDVPVYRVDDALADPASQVDPVAAYRAEK